MKNVILFAMSNLPKTKSLSFNSSDSYELIDPMDPLMRHNPVVENCLSQMEPVARLIMQNYPGDTEYIVLCTPEAETPVDANALFKDEEGKDVAGILEKISAIEFFLLRLRQKGFIDQMEYDEYEELGERASRFVIGNEKKIAFYCIRNLRQTTSQSSDILDATNLAVNEIRRLKKESGDINLFIAANGGFRDNAYVFSSVASMLKLEGIAIKGIYSTGNFPEKDQDGKVTKNGEILDIRKSFEVLDLVSGMNEFEKYGDVDTLIEYFSKKHGKDAENDNVIKAMRNLSNGLSFCNIDLYAEGLDMLRELFFAQSPDSEIMNDDEFKMFKDWFKEDYDKLLASRDGYRIVDIVERCIRKKKLQQALTFVEAKFTDDLYRSGVLYFNPDEEVSTDRSAAEGSSRHKEKAIDYLGYVAMLRKAHEDDCVHFLLQEYGYQKYRDTFTFAGNVFKDVKKKVSWMHAHLADLKQIVQLVKDHGDYPYILRLAQKVSNKEMDPGLMLNERGSFASDLYKCKANKKPVDAGVHLLTDLPTDDTEKSYRLLAGIVLYLYYIFKDTRNRFNHGNAAEQPDHKELIELLEVFCNAADVLLDYADHHGDKHELENIDTRFSLAKESAKRELEKANNAMAGNPVGNHGARNNNSYGNKRRSQSYGNNRSYKKNPVKSGGNKPRM